MNELSPRAKELMRQASRGGGPSELRRRALKGTMLAAAATPAVAAAATAKVLIALVLSLAVSGGVVFIARKHASPPAPAPSENRSEAAAPTPVSPAPPVEAAPVRSAIEAPVAATGRPMRNPEPAAEVSAPKAVRTGFALELDALDRAVGAVEAKHFDEGLILARAFSNDFPDSEFAIEARVVEVLALCGLSRIDEARSAAARLPPAASRNPAVRRLDDSCADQFVP